jgi:hypothetical protein
MGVSVIALKNWTLCHVQCNLDLVTINLVTINLVTTCDLVSTFERPFFNLIHKNNIFSDIMRFSDSFLGDQKCH